MRYRKLGNTGLYVSETGFGTIPILSGNVPVLPEYFSPDTDEAVRIMRYAYELGCNFYDTAVTEEYGDAEYKLGQFAKTVDMICPCVVSSLHHLRKGESAVKNVRMMTMPMYMCSMCMRCCARSSMSFQ